MDGIPLTISQLANLSGWAVLALLMALGWLVPKRTVDREQKILLREAEAWKATVDTQAAQLSAILEELQRPATRRRVAAPERGQP
jgi:hypothetical protein